jgi:hypothetical protein
LDRSTLPKTRVELKLHRKSLTRMVCICTYPCNLDPPQPWLLALRVRQSGRPRMMDDAFCRAMSHKILQCSCRSVALEPRSVIAGLMRHHCRARCSPMQNERPIPPLGPDRGRAIPIAKRSQRGARANITIHFASARHVQVNPTHHSCQPAGLSPAPASWTLRGIYLPRRRHLEENRRMLWSH